MDKMIVEIDAARHNAESEQAHVTVFLFTGDQITGIVQQSEQLDNLAPPPMSA